MPLLFTRQLYEGSFSEPALASTTAPMLTSTYVQVSHAVSRSDDLVSGTLEHGSASEGKLADDIGDSETSARAEALARTNRRLQDLLQSIVLGKPGTLGRSSPGRARPPSISRSSPGMFPPSTRFFGSQWTDGGIRGMQSSRSCSPLPRQARDQCGLAEAKVDSRTEDFSSADDEVLSASLDRQRRRRHRRQDDDQFEDDNVPAALPHGTSWPVQSPSGLSRALRSLVNAIQNRETRVATLEADVARVRDGKRKEVEAKEAKLEAMSVESASLHAEVRRVALCWASVT